VDDLPGRPAGRHAAALCEKPPARRFPAKPAARVLLDKETPRPRLSLDIWLRVFPELKGHQSALRDPRDVGHQLFFFFLNIMFETRRMLNFLSIERTAKH